MNNQNHETNTLLSMLFSKKVLSLSAVASSFVIVYFLWFRKHSRQKKPTSVIYPLINEVLFFSDKYGVCYSHRSYHSDCDSDDCGLKKLKKMIAYLESATTSIDICMFAITSEKLGNAVLKKFNEGVRIRIITDASMAFERGSQIPLFRKNGVLIRTRDSTQFLMHHKFAVIDKHLLLTGSFNWTQQATFGNWENVLITNNPESTIQAYCNQFEELWALLNN